MRRQMLNILAGHNVMMNHEMVAAEGRPTSRGPLVFAALASACVFCVCPILNVLFLAHMILYFWADWNEPSFVFQLKQVLLPLCFGECGDARKVVGKRA